MSSMAHHCRTCEADIMDNKKYVVCPICKSTDITNWFDEESELISIEEIEAEE